MVIRLGRSSVHDTFDAKIQKAGGYRGRFGGTDRDQTCGAMVRLSEQYGPWAATE